MNLPPNSTFAAMQGLMLARTEQTRFDYWLKFARQGVKEGWIKAKFGNTVEPDGCLCMQVQVSMTVGHLNSKVYEWQVLLTSDDRKNLNCLRMWRKLRAEVFATGVAECFNSLVRSVPPSFKAWEGAA
jgi:hypothetical protein